LADAAGAKSPVQRWDIRSALPMRKPECRPGQYRSARRCRFVARIDEGRPARWASIWCSTPWMCYSLLKAGETGEVLKPDHNL